MPRIIGVDIPGNRKIEYALRYIYGIGPTRSRLLVSEANLDPTLRAHQLTDEQLNSVAEIITKKKYLVEGDLRRSVLMDIKHLRSIRCYRGIRHERGLPVRGQNTKNNSRTRKNMKKKR